MRLLLIVNTSASSVTARARVVIHKALSGGHEVALKETNRRGHAARLAQGAAAEGVDVVVVLGGDGTLNEAANGLAGTEAALAVLPGGSTNVFARTIGMANDAIEATNQLLDALAAGSISRVGLGQANGRYFLFHAGIGFDAAVVARVEQLAPLKRYTGPLVFVMATISSWARGYGRRRPHFDLDTGATTVEGSLFTICLNTDPYTYLGSRPLHVAPGTSLDGALSLVSFQRLDLAALAPVAVAALRDGHKVAGSPHVRTITDVHKATVSAARPVPYQLDGDYMGEADKIELRWQPDAISLVRPVVSPLRPALMGL